MRRFYMLLLTANIVPAVDYWVFGGRYGVALMEHIYWGSRWAQQYWNELF